MLPQETIDTFWNALIIMGKGMMGIFIFMTIFYFIIVFLDNVFPADSEKKEKAHSSE